MRSTCRAGTALLVLLLAGCRPTDKSGGSDAAYLSASSEAPAVTRRTNLFPIAVGSRWTSVGATSDGQKLTMETRVAGTRRVGAVTGVLFDIRLNGRPVQQEVYRVDAAGIQGLATGPGAGTVILPPLPLLRYPASEGATCAWRGTLKAGKTRTPAEASCRVGGLERVTTPAGSFQAYRLEVLMTTLQKQRKIGRVSRMWLAPNVGIVQQDYGAGKARVRLKLTRFQTAD